MICKYCGKEIPKGKVWNPDGNGNGYHHKCLIDMEFDKNEAYIKNLKKRSIIIPEGATNGDMLKTVFPSDANELDMSKLHLMYDGLDYIKEFRKDWWNAPYKKEVE